MAAAEAAGFGNSVARSGGYCKANTAGCAEDGGEKQEKRGHRSALSLDAEADQSSHRPAVMMAME